MPERFYHGFVLGLMVDLHVKALYRNVIKIQQILRKMYRIMRKSEKNENFVLQYIRLSIVVDGATGIHINERKR